MVVKNISKLAWFIIGIIIGYALAVYYQPLSQPTFTPTQLPTQSFTPTFTPTHPEILGVYFSPNGGAENAIIYWIGRANKSIHVLIYSFTLDEIGSALIQAKQRGVDVKVVFEKSAIDKYSEYFKLKIAGVDVKNDTNPALMHMKVAIIDDMIVITGSYNWSWSAEHSNNENLIIIKDPTIAEKYEQVFQQIYASSV